MKNNLHLEKSPYLLQHKNNPVWWQAWNEETFTQARLQNKIIFLSIGYSTCHWCHVMEHESFENIQVAQILNEHFICIKVDREELPQVDKIYMEAIHTMGMRGGWPLSVFLTSELKPFWGGTYFPTESFMGILKQIHQLWINEPNKILNSAAQLTEHIQIKDSLGKEAKEIKDDIFLNAFSSLQKNFDTKYGGFGGAPKFPPSMRLRAMLRLWAREKDQKIKKEILDTVDTTLEGMFCGGLYDHIGGGFARYSTDEKWLIPHFEKMLYDNANLVLTYLEAYQVTKNPVYKEIAREALDYILRDMSYQVGGYFSAEDADSEGEEGKFYVWKEEELKKILTKEEFKVIQEIYGVSLVGNFEHQTNHLNLLSYESDLLTIFQPAIKKIREKIFSVRKKRIHPHKDDKILTAWNGLMIEAMAKGYQVLGDEKYLHSAQKSTQFLKEKMQHGELKRRYRDGETKFSACLEDYTFLISGLLSLYESDFDHHWILWAEDLQQQQEILWSKEHQAYYFSSEDKHLITQSIDLMDGAEPNANAVSLLNLLRLYHLTYQENYLEKAKQLMQTFSPLVKQYPLAVCTALWGFDFYLGQPKEMTLLGNGEDKFFQGALHILYQEFLPNKVLTVKIKEGLDKTIVSICQNKICLNPIHDINSFKKDLNL